MPANTLKKVFAQKFQNTEPSRNPTKNVTRSPMMSVMMYPMTSVIMLPKNLARIIPMTIFIKFLIRIVKMFISLCLNKFLRKNHSEFVRGLSHTSLQIGKLKTILILLILLVALMKLMSEVKKIMVRKFQKKKILLPKSLPKLLLARIFKVIHVVWI